MILEKESHPEFYVGVNSDIDTAAEKLTDMSVTVRKYVYVKADAGNAGVIYVGKSNVSASNGYPLAAGEEVKIPIDDPSKIYVIASQVDQSAKWFAV